MNSKEIYLKIFNNDPEYSGEGAEWSDKHHFTILKKYSNLCESVTEFGVYDWNTTWAFISSDIKKLRCYDGKVNRGKFHRENGGYKDVVRCCEEEEIDFEFVHADTRKCEIESTDMLFLDTWHTYDQVKSELRFANKVKKYIIFHDTVLYGKVGSGGNLGILPAIYDFLIDNYKEWQVLEDDKHSNGIMVIGRVE